MNSDLAHNNSRGTAPSAFSPPKDTSTGPVVRFEQVSKRFGATAAVDQVSLDILPGELFALLGPSGCGKTTLLRLLAGLEMPDSGRVLLDGDDLAPVPAYRRPVNMMFQSYALFPHLNVESNVAFGLKQDRLPRQEIATRVAEMLSLVRLENLAKRKPEQLSGGERQRVALARSLAKRPRVLLLDEPLAALDKKLRGETQFELMQLQQKLGLTFIMVTHDQQEAMTMADRIAVMDEGHVIQVAGPREIYEQPSSRWIADFIGDVNLIEGQVIATQADGTAIGSTGVGQLRASRREGNVGDCVWVALRPEKVRISRLRLAPANENCVAGVITKIRYLGELSSYEVLLDSGTLMKATLANVAATSERSLGVNDRVWLTWPADALVVLTR
jgi:putrescine transport system ATP-binding protein